MTRPGSWGEAIVSLIAVAAPARVAARPGSDCAAATAARVSSPSAIPCRSAWLANAVSASWASVPALGVSLR